MQFMRPENKRQGTQAPAGGALPLARGGLKAEEKEQLEGARGAAGSGRSAGQGPTSPIHAV